MQVEIEREKVNGVQVVCGNALTQHQADFTVPEVLFGLAELMGRTLANNMGGTIIEKMDVLKTLTDHAERTVRMGWIANGGNVFDN